MIKREQLRKPIMKLASGVIVALQTAIFAYIWFRYYASSEVIQETFWHRGNYVVIGQYALMIYFFYKIYGGFKVGYLRVFDVLWSQILSVLCVNAITYLQLCLIGRWRFLSHLSPIIQMTGFDLILVVVWVLAARWMYLAMFPPRRLILVYGAYDMKPLIQKISARDDKFNICERISVDEGIEEIQSRLGAYDGVILADIPAETRNTLLKYCFRQNIRCYSVPKISDIMLKSATEIHLFDTALLLLRNQGPSPRQRFMKRAFDIILSLLLIAVLSPVMLVIALIIKLYDRGPVFFTQDRLTQGGRVFKVLKFRSMRVQTQTGTIQMTRKHDDRVTPVGKVLRAIHFDELPQLFNILLGDMSFVGPRPETPEIAEMYCKVIPEFDFRLKMKAGLTGYAQVYGKYNTTPYDKLKLDLSYIMNYSFMLDLKLMMLTVKILFQKENTEGIEDWQTTAATAENLEKINQK